MRDHLSLKWPGFILFLGILCAHFTAQAGSLRYSADVTLSQNEIIEGDSLSIDVNNLSAPLPEGSSIFIQVFPYLWDGLLSSTSGYQFSSLSPNSPLLTSSGGSVTFYPTISDRTDGSSFLIYKVDVSLIVVVKHKAQWYNLAPQYITVYKK